MDISDAEQVGPDDIAAMAGVVKRHFDYIIVDCPHEFSGRSLKACALSDKILLVAQQTIPAVKSVQQVIAFFQGHGF